MKKIILLLLLISFQAAYSQWEPCNNGLYGGKVQCMAKNNDVMLIGTKNGVYFSTDKGDSWFAKNNGLYSLNIQSLLIKEGLLFAGTDGGLYKSTNQGEFWTRQIDITNNYIVTLASKDNYIYAGTEYNGLFISNDNGNSWMKKEVTSGMLGAPTSIAFKGDTIYIGFSNAGLYFSTDNGESWIENNANRLDIGVTCLAIQGNYIYVCSQTGIFRSNDNCKTWTLLPLDGIRGIALIGSNLLIQKYYNILLSTDNGDTYTVISKEITGLVKLFIYENNGELFAGTNRGLLFTKDNGINWNLSNNGLVNTEVMTINFLNSTIYLGTFGNGIYQSQNNGDDWDEASNGYDQSRISPNEIRVLYQKGNEILAGTNGDGMYRLSDSSDTWVRNWKDYDSNEHPEVNFQITSIISKDNTIFTGTLAGLYSSNDDGKTWITNTIAESKRATITALGKNQVGFFAGTLVGVYFSSDSGSTWIEKNSGLESKDICSFETIDDRIYVSTGRNGLYFLSDDDNTWIALPKINDSYQPIKRFTIKDGTIFALLDKLGVFLSSDNGASWKEANFGLQYSNLYSIEAIGDFVFAGSLSSGLYRAKIADLLDAVSGVGKGLGRADISIFPNPAGDFITVTLKPSEGFEPSEGSEIQIYNTLGEKVMSESIHPMTASHRMNIESLPKGIYFVKVGGKTAKFVKM